MNKVVEFLATITDEQLRTALAEFKILDETAELPQGLVRQLEADLAARADISSDNARKVLETSLFRMAAYRWAGLSGN